MIEVINIKSNYPPADVAVFDMGVAINDAKRKGVKALIVVHGYGSHGMGGLIKKMAVDYLSTARKKGEITLFVKGENWSDLNPDKIKACEICPELILNPQLNNMNSGVSVVIL